MTAPTLAARAPATALPDCVQVPSLPDESAADDPLRHRGDTARQVGLAGGAGLGDVAAVDLDGAGPAGPVTVADRARVVGEGDEVAVSTADGCHGAPPFLHHGTGMSESGAIGNHPGVSRRARRDDPAYHKHWKYDRHRGITRYTPAAPIRAHIARLNAAGYTNAAIARAARLPRETVSQITRLGRPNVQRRIAEAVLTVTPRRAIEATPSGGTVPGIGAIRRVEALLANGWRHQDLQDRSVPSRNILEFRRPTVTRATHDAACAAYDALWDQPGPSPRVRDRAAARGYLPPLAWDDETIDDPETAPYTGTDPAGIDIDDIAMLARLSYPTSLAAERLGVTRDALTRRIRRAGRDDLARRFAINDDRPTAKETTA